MPEIEVKNYVTEVEAVHFSDESQAWDIAEWCEGYTDKTGDFVTVRFPPDYWYIEVGEWLIKYDDYDYAPCSDEDFKRRFRPLDTTTETVVE